MSDDLHGRSLIRAAMSAPYLERDEEHDLAVRWKQNRDQEALHRITTAHMRLVISMAGEVPAFRPADGRPDPGRPCRPARGRRALRAGARGALFDLCDVVDPGLDPGLHPAQLVDRARRHQFGAEGAVLQSPAAARPPGARAGTALQRLDLPGDLGRARRLGRRRRDDGFAPFGARHLAQRAAGRRRQRLVRPHGFPGLRRSAARRDGGRGDRRRAPHRVAAAGARRAQRSAS